MNARELQLTKDRKTIGKMIALTRLYKNAYLERREGAYKRMQEQARKSLRFVLR